MANFSVICLPDNITQYDLKFMGLHFTQSLFPAKHGREADRDAISVQVEKLFPWLTGRPDILQAIEDCESGEEAAGISVALLTQFEQFTGYTSSRNVNWENDKHVVFTADGNLSGIIVNYDAGHCRIEDCLGRKMSIRWEDGRLTQLCQKEMKRITEGIRQITRSDSDCHETNFNLPPALQKKESTLEHDSDKGKPWCGLDFQSFMQLIDTQMESVPPSAGKNALRNDIEQLKLWNLGDGLFAIKAHRWLRYLCELDTGALATYAERYATGLLNAWVIGWNIWRIDHAKRNSN